GIQDSNRVDGTGTFLNTGTMTRTSAGSTLFAASTVFDNTGSLITHGTMILGTGGTNTGRFDTSSIASGGAGMIDFSSGTYLNDLGSDLRGDGAVVLSNGNAVFNGLYSVKNTIIQNGTGSFNNVGAGAQTTDSYSQTGG